MRNVVLALALTLTAAAQPAPEAFLGYPIGERFTPHHRIVGYFEELDRQSPRMSLEKIGESWEGRPLLLAAITSEANQAALESIRSRVARIAEGEAGAETLAAETPAVVWLGFGVHGNE